MSPQRRDVLKGLGGVAAMAAFGKLGAQVTGVSAPAEPNGQPGQAPTFPRKADFEIEAGYTYINAAKALQHVTSLRTHFILALLRRRGSRRPLSG